MNTTDPLKQPSFYWRRIRAWAFNATAIVIIALAVVVGIGRLLTPFVNELKPHLETGLSQALDAEVRIDRLSASWPGFMPSLTLEGLSIEQSEVERFRLELAVIEIHWLNAFKRHEVMLHVAVVGPRMVMTQQPAGDWQFMLAMDGDSIDPSITDGLSGPNDTDQDPSPPMMAGDWPDWLGLSIRDASWVLEPLDASPIDLHLAEADFSKNGPQHRLTGWLSAAKNAPEQVQFRISLSRQDNRWVRGSGWLKAQQVSVSHWLEEAGFDDVLSVKTVMSGEAWLVWDQSNGGRMDADISWVGPQGVVDAYLKLERSEDVDGRTIQLEVSKMDFDGEPMALGVVVGISPKAYAVAVETADLTAIHQALDPWLDGYGFWPAELKGQIEQLQLGTDRQRRAHHAQGQIKGLVLALDQPDLLIEGLSAELGLLGDQLSLSLEDSLSLSWPEMFREKVALSTITGQVIVGADALHFDRVEISNSLLDASISGAIYQQATGPFVDLAIEAKRIEAVDVRPFLPIKVIPEPAMAWLDEALLHVGQARGYALLHFPVGLRTPDFQPGHLQSRVMFSGVEMAYARNWPVANNLEGSVYFSGQSLQAEVEGGEVNGLRLAAPKLSIAKLSDAVIELDIEGQSVSSKTLSETLGQLPFQGWSEVFDQMQWSGLLDASVSVALPVKNRAQWAIDGEVQFADNQVSFVAPGILLDALQGGIVFNRDNIQGDKLSAVFDGQRLALGTEISFQPQVQVDVTTELDVGLWLAEKDWATQWRQWIDGQTQVRLRLTPASQGGGLATKIETNLEGVAINLPPPLNKSRELAWPVEVSRQSAQPQDPWRVLVNEAWQAWLRPLDSGWSVAVLAGSDGQAASVVPTDRGLWVTGSVGEFDLGAWQALWQALPKQDVASQAILNNDWMALFNQRIRVDVDVEALKIPGVVPNQASVGAVWRDDQWVVNVDGPSVRGEVLWPTNQDRSRAVVVDLEHAYLVTSPAEPDSDQIPAPDLQDPRQARPLTVLIESLYWGDLALGSTRVETHATANGVEIELIDIDGPDLRLQARGRWVQDETGEPRSMMDGRLSSRNFNQLIRATGYEAGLRAQQATLDFDLNWPGMPFDFHLFRVAGGFDFVLRGGNIPQASAGAGRLLGLVSFSALPRRLILDFRDVFASGFPFDGIQGRFDMQQGMAQTDSVRIAAPAAVITLSGSTDMIARTYDQVVVVEPGLGSTLPVIGGLTGGPVGAAAGLILQSILNQPLKGVSMARYTIQGPWSEPVIELVDAQVAEAARAASDQNKDNRPPQDGGGR